MPLSSSLSNAAQAWLIADNVSSKALNWQSQLTLGTTRHKAGNSMGTSPCQPLLRTDEPLHPNQLVMKIRKATKFGNLSINAMQIFAAGSGRQDRKLLSTEPEQWPIHRLTGVIQGLTKAKICRETGLCPSRQELYWSEELWLAISLDGNRLLSSL